MASTKKTAVALASILTFITSGVQADLSTGNIAATNDLNSASQTDMAGGATSSDQAAKPKTMPVLSPIKKKWQDKESIDQVEATMESVADKNLGMDAAFEAVNDQDKNIVSKPEASTADGNEYKVVEPADCQAETDTVTENSAVASTVTTPEAVTEFAQQESQVLDSSDSLTQTEGMVDAESKIQALIQELAPELGGEEKAEEAVLQAVDNLDGEYDETEVVDKLRKTVLASENPTPDTSAPETNIPAAVDTRIVDEAAAQSEIDAQKRKVKEADENIKKLDKESKELDAASKKSSEKLEQITNEKKELSLQSSQTNEDLMNVISKQQEATINNASDELAKIAAEKVEMGAKQIKADSKAAREAADQAEQAKKDSPILKPKPSTETDVAEKIGNQDEIDKKVAADGELAADLKTVIVEEENKQDSATRQVYTIDESTLANPVTAEESQKKAEGMKKTQIEQALLAEHFLKVAKRSRAFLLAISEQQALEPRIRGVENATKASEEVIDRQINTNAKVLGRDDFVMRETEIVNWLEILSEAIYEGIGIPRTFCFDLAKLTPLYPPSRLHFDYNEMVYKESFNDLIDEMANQKAQNLSLRRVADEIVENLKNAPGENYEGAQLTINDYLSKMFLDSGKGTVDTTRLAVEMFDDHFRTVSESPDSVSDLKVEKCFAFTETQKDLIMEEYQEIKSDFSLYSTFAFLTDDLTASFELISETTALEQSNISARFTRTAVNSDIYQIRRPHEASHYVVQANDSEQQTIWANQTINLGTD